MNADQLLKCHERIKPYITRTPVLTSSALDHQYKTELFFKCENFQPMGAFKMRGAAHAILQLSPEEQAKGVVTHSSGNFAQALSLAARNIGVPAHIVMPDIASRFKKEAVRGYGASIRECASTTADRELQAAQVQKETGATFIHPSNDLAVILGQATAAMELLEDHPDLKYILVPVGGGGLLAGTALAARFFGTDCKVIAGEPLAVDDAYRSFHSGTLQTNTRTDTIADGLRTDLGDVNFPIIRKYVADIIRVTEPEIIAAMRLLWERLKITAEPSSAVAMAALIKEKERFAGEKVGVIISGGNVDLDQLPF